MLFRSWVYSQIEAANHAGIIQGYSDGTFRPEQVVTRDQAAVFLARALAGGDSKVPAGPTIASFKDVATNYWAFKYIEYVKAKGIISGYSDGTFRPTINVTRDQMAVLIARAIAGGDSKVPAGPTTPTFKDVGTSYWAYKYIEYLAKKGIISGYSDGTFHPTENLTRAQAAVYISKAFIPTITADPASEIQWTSVTIKTNIISMGNPPATERGIYLYSGSSCSGSVIRNPKVTGSAITGVYLTKIFNLTPNMTYSYKAYAKNPLEGISLCKSFQTLTANPTVTAQQPSLADDGTKATLNGNITNIGLTQPTERGFYLYNGNACAGSAIQNPKQTPGPYNTGVFSLDVSGLNPDTDYSYRSYAINSSGKGTSNCLSFHTPVIYTSNISGKVTDASGNPLSNGYLVLEDDIIKINSDGTYTDNGLDATTYDVEIFDQNGNQYESPNLNVQIISPVYGNNTINFSGLVKQ